MAIIGRTNAGVIGFEEVIARAQAYEKAGADAICLVGIEDFDHLESIASQLSKPLMLVTYGNPNLRDNARLAALGVRIVVNGHAAYRDQGDLRLPARAASGRRPDLNASQLSVKYSTADEYALAEEYMQVRSR